MALANKSLIDPVTNEIKLSSWQDDFVFNESRYKIACCGRRSGKTIASCVIAYMTAVSKPYQKVWAVATTYGQAKKLYFQELQRIIPKEWIVSANKSDLEITLINGSVIELKGANNEDALLGDSLDLLIMDEYQSVNPEVMDKLTPMLADRKGALVVVGTPRGFNAFYDIWAKGQESHPDFDNQYYSIQVKTVDAETIDPVEIEDAKNRMTASMFAQEFEASFESVEGLVYKEFDKIDSMNTDVTIGNADILHIGLDFNVGKMVAVVGVRRGAFLYLVDEIVLSDTTTKEMAKTMKERYPNNQIIVYPDPAGSARSTTGNTNFQILQQHGLTINAFKSHPRIADRVNCVNAAFCNAHGVRKLFVNPKCTETLKTLKGQIYNKMGDPEKDTGLDHAADALGYLVCKLYPMAGQQIQTFGAY